MIEEQTIPTLQISPSAVGASECPFYMKAQQDKKAQGIYDEEDENSKIFLLEGRFGHLVLEKYVSSLINLKMTSDLKLFQDIFETIWESNQYIPESSYDELHDDALLPFIEGFELDLDHVYQPEMKIALDWNLNRVEWEDKTAWLRAKLDLVSIYPEESTVLIDDYKFGRHIPASKQLEKSLQTVIYPFAFYQLNKFIEKFYVRYRYVRWNKTLEPIEVQKSDFDVIEKRLRGFTVRMAKKMADKDAVWVAKPCGLCAICNEPCPLLNKDGTMLIRTLEDAKELARMRLRKAQELKDIDKKLKDFAEESNIDIEAGTFGFHPTSTLRGFKADKLVEFALENKVDVNLLVSPDTKKIKKLNEDNIKKQILAMAKESIGSKFSFKKKGQEPDEDKEGEE